MQTYHKIQTVFKRNPDTKFRTLLEGDFALPEFEYLKDNQWIFTEKVDGTNIRVMFDGTTITFGGKTNNASIPSFLITRLQTRFLSQVEKFKAVFSNGDICLYGEGYGAKIQKGGGNYRQDQDIVFFDIKIGDWWLLRKDVEDIASQLDLDVVPKIGLGTLKEMVEKARIGFQSHWGDFLAEGIVAHPEIELRTRNGERIITKIKYKDFLGEV